MIAPESAPLPRLLPERLGSALADTFQEAGIRLALGRTLETLSQDADNALTLQLISPKSENWRSPRTPDRTRIYISNASTRSIRLEWIDFTGNPRSFGAEMRPTDHTQQQTYAGHVWRLVDDKTNTVLHYFVATKSPGKLIYKPGKK